MTKDYTRGGQPVATWTDETTVYASGEDDFECGVSQDHPAREGDPTCPECDADLSSWRAEDDDGS